VRPDCPVKCTSGPGQLNITEGVRACIALASAGGVDGSLFTAKRPLPWWSPHLQGEVKVTGSDPAAAAPQISAIAIVNAERVIASIHI